MKCKSCNASLDLARTACPACGTAVDLGRLTGLLGLVCRACDAYNEPGARSCAACGASLGVADGPGPGADATAAAPAAAPPAPAAAPAPPAPGVRGVARPSPGATRVLPAATVRAPAAAPAPARATLVLEAAGGETRSFPVGPGGVGAGRAAAVAFPEDPCLAPLHATFFERGGALHVRDEGAPGGVFLRLRGLSAPLRAGDHFAVGERLLRYAGPLPAAAGALPDGTRRLGSPRPPAPAVVVEEWLEGGASGRVFVRTGPAVTIGRAGAALSLGDDPAISPAHAELRVDAGGAVRLRDLGSTAGTWTRVPPHGERELRPGDRVRLGREVLRVEVAPA